MEKIKEKVLITGGNRGLGYELVKVFLRNGYEVFAVVRSIEGKGKLEKEFKENCYPIVADISSDDSIKIIKSTLTKYTDQIDILINNAGITAKEHEIMKVTTNEMSNLFHIHCLGVVRTVQATLEMLYNSKNPRIINVSSRLGSLTKMASGEFKGRNFSYSYRIAKAAQNMLTICLDQELRDKGIYLGAIHPGKLKTNMAASDADMNPSEGANNIYNWVSSLKVKDRVEFVQPLVNELEW
ncbi:SDR family NAD(P)-dependent oxidoreductase [Anaeromicrobium sediminis]|uniref:SDR family NAD(P)-dependent oxidoreductase n=1 Tax=Anaeromicrobium sediminis TaxID=1478221 RepID=UPI001A9A6E4A|nr:SDR family NAD(P)-dependent oxidoreductase [Anaeromicrobium sediminis]